MVMCSAFHCGSHSNKKEADVSFHRFPNDPGRCILWLENMKLLDWTPSKNARLCSKHFEGSFFYRTNMKIRLHNDAVPTILSQLPSYTPPIPEEEETTFENVTEEETTFENVTEEETTFENVTEEETTFENVTEEETTFENVTEEETTFENVTEEETTFENITEEETTFENITEADEADHSTSSEEDLPTKNNLRRKLFLEVTKSREKSKKLKVLGQTLKRYRERISSMQSLIEQLEQNNVVNAESSVIMSDFPVLHIDVLHTEVDQESYQSYTELC